MPDLHFEDFTAGAALAEAALTASAEDAALYAFGSRAGNGACPPSARPIAALGLRSLSDASRTARRGWAAQVSRP